MRTYLAINLVELCHLDRSSDTFGFVQAPAGVPTVITGQEKRVHETAFIWTKFM
jgi:hypothetical protein